MVVELATWYAASATSYAELFVVNGLVTGKKIIRLVLLLEAPVLFNWQLFSPSGASVGLVTWDQEFVYG